MKFKNSWLLILMFTLVSADKPKTKPVSELNRRQEVDLSLIRIDQVILNINKAFEL